MVAQLVQRFPPTMQRWMLKTITWWPPFWGAGIRLDEVSDDFLRLQSSLRMRWFNRNYVNTHFGGSIYSMTDPFYMLMLIQHLGPQYVVWDVAAQIQFRSPGRGTIRAVFELTREEIAAVKAAADSHEKTLFKKRIDVKDDAGNIVARVRKTIYVRRKRGRAPAPAQLSLPSTGPRMVVGGELLTNGK